MARGSGSIRPGTAPGSWELRVQLKADIDPTLKRKKGPQPSRTVYGSRHDAVVALAAFRHEMDTTGPVRADRSMSLADLVALHLETHELESSTLRGYLQKYQKHILPSVVGQMRAAKVTGPDLSRFYKALATTKGLDPSTIRQVSAIISGAYKRAMEWNIGLTQNPARGVSLPRVKDANAEPGGDERAPAPEVVTKMFAAVTDSAARTGYWISAFLGLRCGEVVALRLSDLSCTDTGETEIHVRHSIVEITASDIRDGVTPKPDYVAVGPFMWMKDCKGHAKRTLTVDPVTAGHIATHLLHLEARAASDDVKLDDPFLFSLDADGSRPWRPSLVGLRWSRLAHKLEQEGVRLHDLRHFAGTQMSATGTNIPTIMRRLGHKQVSTTLRYVKGTTPEDRASAAAMGELARRMLAAT